MYYNYLPFLLAIAGANPIFLGTPQGLELAYGGLGLEHHLTPLISTPIHKLGSLQQIANPKSLLTSHIYKTGALAIPMTLALTSGIHKIPAISIPMKEVEKITAGALIKGIPKVSKLPITVAYSPKLSGFSGQSGVLESPLIAGMSYGSSLGGIGGGLGNSLGGIGGIGGSYGF